MMDTAIWVIFGGLGSRENGGDSPGNGGDSGKWKGGQIEQTKSNWVRCRRDRSPEERKGNTILGDVQMLKPVISETLRRDYIPSSHRQRTPVQSLRTYKPEIVAISGLEIGILEIEYTVLLCKTALGSTKDKSQKFAGRADRRNYPIHKMA